MSATAVETEERRRFRPSLGATLSDEPALYDEVFSWGTKTLGLGVT